VLITKFPIAHSIQKSLQRTRYVLRYTKTHKRQDFAKKNN